MDSQLGHEVRAPPRSTAGGRDRWFTNSPTPGTIQHLGLLTPSSTPELDLSNIHMYVLLVIPPVNQTMHQSPPTSACRNQMAPSTPTRPLKQKSTDKTIAFFSLARTGGSLATASQRHAWMLNVHYLCQITAALASSDATFSPLCSSRPQHLHTCMQIPRCASASSSNGRDTWPNKTFELCWPPTVCPESTHAQGEKGCLSHDHDKCDLLFCFILFSFGLF